MTKEAKTNMLRMMLDPDDNTDPDTLEVFLELAAQKVLNRMYPYKDDYTGLEVPDRYAMIQLNICVYWLNKRGAEGEIQHIENGIHRNYGSSDVPDSMLKDVVPYAQAIR